MMDCFIQFDLGLNKLNRICTDMSIFSKLFGKKPVNNRRHPRVFGSGIRVKIDSHTYYADDASLSGIKLRGCKEDYPDGMTLNADILLNISHRQETLPVRVVVWQNNTDGLILRFKKMPSYTKKVYEDFINVSVLDVI